MCQAQTSKIHGNCLNRDVTIFQMAIFSLGTVQMDV